MTPVRLEPAALRSRVKHSTTEPLRSLANFVLAAIFLLAEIVPAANFVLAEIFVLAGIFVFCLFC